MRRANPYIHCPGWSDPDLGREAHQARTAPGFDRLPSLCICVSLKAATSTYYACSGVLGQLLRNRITATKHPMFRFFPEDRTAFSSSLESLVFGFETLIAHRCLGMVGCSNPALVINPHVYHFRGASSDHLYYSVYHIRACQRQYCVGALLRLHGQGTDLLTPN